MSVFSSQNKVLVIFKEHFVNQTLINFINKLNGFCYLGKFQNENQRTEQPVLTPGWLYIRTEFPWGELLHGIVVQHFTLLTFPKIFSQRFDFSQNLSQPSENRPVIQIRDRKQRLITKFCNGASSLTKNKELPLLYIHISMNFLSYFWLAYNFYKYKLPVLIVINCCHAAHFIK